MIWGRRRSAAGGLLWRPSFGAEHKSSLEGEVVTCPLQADAEQGRPEVIITQPLESLDILPDHLLGGHPLCGDGLTIHPPVPVP